MGTNLQNVIRRVPPRAGEPEFDGTASGLHNKGTGTMVESVVGGCGVKIVSLISVCFRIYCNLAGPSFGLLDVHHADSGALKAAEHYGGFERYLSPKFLDQRICYVKSIIDNLMIICSGSCTLDIVSP